MVFSRFSWFSAWVEIQSFWFLFRYGFVHFVYSNRHDMAKKNIYSSRIYNTLFYGAAALNHHVGMIFIFGKLNLLTDELKTSANDRCVLVFGATQIRMIVDHDQFGSSTLAVRIQLMTKSFTYSQGFHSWMRNGTSFRQSTNKIYSLHILVCKSPLITHPTSPNTLNMKNQITKLILYEWN